MRIFGKTTMRSKLFIVLGLSVGSAAAAESSCSYYMVVFGTEGHHWHNPYEAHTFATFLEVREGDDGSKDINAFTISWLADDGSIRIFSKAVPGKNFGLRKSLDISVSRGRRLYRWGPYRIRKGLYDLAIAQLVRLNSGSVKYKVFDRQARLEGSAMSCFHAVADIDRENGLLITRGKYGRGVTELVITHLRHWIIDPEVTHHWISRSLGLQHYHFVEH